MTVMKERAIDLICRMPEDKLYYVVQLLESVEGLSENMEELQYELVENVLRAEDFIQLKAAVGMLDRPLDQVEKALKNGLFHVSAVCNGKTVGMGRLVGDGAMYWYLQDIIVLPEYQGKGIGKSIVNRLLAYFRSTASPGTKIEVGLTSVKGKEPFYEKLGFSIGATGMRLWIDIE